jgi:ethanolamine permease
VFGDQPLTANIVTIAVFGSITMYIVSMMALIRLRKSEPNLERPYRAPFYPVFPIISLTLAVICLIVLIYYNWSLLLVFLGILALAYVYYLLSGKKVPPEEIAAEVAEIEADEK